jgi:hypothetical protein
MRSSLRARLPTGAHGGPLPEEIDPEMTFRTTSSAGLFALATLLTSACVGEIGGGAGAGSDDDVTTPGGDDGGGDDGGDDGVITPGGDPVAPSDLDIPTAHPRVWFTPERVDRAKAYFARKPFTAPARIESADDAIDAALHTVVSGQAAGCERAIDWAKGITFTLDGVASDGARWYGEAVILTYDWCFGQLAGDEESLLRERWNTYLTALNDKDWGGIGMEGNNYYTGYFRNTILWAIASWHENRRPAEAFLDYAMNTRWNTSLLPYFNGDAKGGAPAEGSAYGRRTFGYLTAPFTALGLVGQNMWNQTPYFIETVFWSIYSTTPGTSRVMGASEQLHETFPYNEDERWLTRDARSNTAMTSLGSYLAPLIAQFADQPVAGYARRFMDMTGARIENKFIEYVNADDVAAVAPRDLSTLPLDYYASGMGMLYSKSSWDGDATFVNHQFGPATHAGHSHRDAGSFQIWRAGEFLSRESVGYAENLAGYAGTGAVDAESPVAHNTLLYGGQGSNTRYRAVPTVLRMASTDVATYAAVDLSAMYDVPADWQHREAEVGNPRAGRTVRETLFIRPLETLVVFDRMESTGDDSVVKSFLMHFPVNPTVSGNTVTAVQGTQKITMTTAVPADAQRRIVDESAGGAYAIGQFRSEIETSGEAISHFAHVITTSAASDAAVTVEVAETTTSYTLTVRHPTRGTAVVVFEKGIESRGGSFGYAASGAPSPSPLRTTVQAMTVSAAGPTWRN